MDQLIADLAVKYSLNPLLIRAIIETESGFNTWAYRYEPNYKYTLAPSQYARKLGITDDSELMGQRTSWGMMQVMGALARECGFTEYLPKLCLPENGLEYGCLHLARLMKRYGNMRDAIAAYNAGSVVHEMSGLYRNQEYVRRVLTHFKELGGVE